MLRRFEASPSRCPRLMGMASSGRERGALAIVQVRCRRYLVARADPGEGPESTCAVKRRRFPDPMGRQARFR